MRVQLRNYTECHLKILFKLNEPSGEYNLKEFSNITSGVDYGSPSFESLSPSSVTREKTARKKEGSAN